MRDEAPDRSWWSADWVAEDDAYVASGLHSKLSFSQARNLGRHYEGAMADIVGQLSKPNRVRLVEVGCSSESRLTAECLRRFGPDSAVRLSFWNGGDIETEKGRALVKRTIEELRPDLVWVAPESGPFSPLQRTNQRTAEQRASLQQKQQQAVLQYEGAASIIRAAAAIGCHTVLELSEFCEAWNHDWYTRLHGDLGFHHGVCKGCQVGLRNAQGVLMCKGWGISSDWGPLVQHLSLSCDGRHARARYEGRDSRHSTSHTEVFAKRVCSFLAQSDSWIHFALEASTAGLLESTKGLALASGRVGDEIESSQHPGSSAASGLTGGPNLPEPGRQPEEGSDALKDIPVEQRRKIFQNLRKIHTASGHCSVDYLVRSLKKRGASKDVLRCASEFRCDVCRERRRPDPRHQATLNSIAPKWHTLQCDAGTWTHPESGQKYQFMIGVDEGCRLRVAKLLFQHQTRTPNTEDFITFLEEQWFPHFGKPAEIRLDPAGCFRSSRLDQYLSERQIMPQHIPAEAHWQLPLAERAVATTKVTMTALVNEHPEMRASEALSRAIWAANSRDVYRGYSPLQHAFGRAPDELGRLGDNVLRDVPILTENGISAEFGYDVKAMLTAERTFLEEQARERLQRAEASGHRPMRQFTPGDLVYVWRRMTPKQEGSKPFRTGRFVGPCRVLATETRVEEGHLRAGSVIWLYRAGNLIKASPEQLRPASAREEAWQELQEPIEIPWTIGDTLAKNPPHSYEDVTSEASHMPATAHRDELERQESGWPTPTRRVTGKRGADQGAVGREVRPREGAGASEWEQGEDPVESSQTPVHAGGRVRSRTPLHRGRPVAHRVPLERADFLEECGLVLPDEPRKFWSSSGAAIELAIDLPKANTKKGKEWMRDLGCFFSRQLRRSNVEVSEKHLSPEQIEGFRKAKHKEVRNFVVAEAFKRLPEHLKPSRDQVLKMRWILTWKLDDSHDPKDGEPLKRDSSNNPLKPKARAVVLGYMDPAYEFRPTSSPTMNRTTRQLFLQASANMGFSISKGDISSAFLQGDAFGEDRPMYCEPLKEICEALEVPEHSTMLLTKAAYGLVEAPLQWYLTVAKFLESIGGERQFSDPCCWGFFRKDRTPIAYVCGHIDDFMFAGKGDCPEWAALRKKIQDRFKWGLWEERKFVQCGVLIQSLDNGGFCLSQPDFLDSICEVNIGRNRAKDLEANMSPGEMHQVRSVLGGLSWHANQVAPQLCAHVGLLLSKVSKGCVKDVLEVNRLVKKARATQHQKLFVHPCPSKEMPVVAAWVDAAHANRVDLGSTKGVVIGCASDKLLKGELTPITPIMWQSARIHRVCRSSAAAETRAAIDAEDELYAVRFQVFEFFGGQVSLWRCDDAVTCVPGVLISDSKNLYDRLSQTVLTLKGAEKRSDIESLCLKESMGSTGVIVRWVNGDSQLANSLTKENEPHQISEYLRRNGTWRIVFDPQLLSGRKRKQLGMDRLDEEPTAQSES